MAFSVRGMTVVMPRFEYPRLQHPPCPGCKSLRTIEVDVKADAKTLFCLDCDCTWTVEPKPARDSHRGE